MAGSQALILKRLDDYHASVLYNQNATSTRSPGFFTSTASGVELCSGPKTFSLPARAHLKHGIGRREGLRIGVQVDTGHGPQLPWMSFLPKGEKIMEVRVRRNNVQLRGPDHIGR